MNPSTAQAVEQFQSVLATKPSKQASKAFLLRQATQFLGQTKTGSQTRQERRLAAKMVAKRMTRKIMNGEEII